MRQRSFSVLRVLWGVMYVLLTLLALETVRVNMRGSVYYGRPRRRYGPGRNIEVPAGLALTLGLTPITEEASGGDAGEPDDNKDFWAQLALTGKQAEALQAAGFGSKEALTDASDEDLLAIDGIGDVTLQKLREATKE